MGHEASHDCICGEGGFWRYETTDDAYPDDAWPEPHQGWSNEGKAIEFIEQAVVEKVERDRHLKPAKAIAMDQLMGYAE